MQTAGEQRTFTVTCPRRKDGHPCGGTVHVVAGQKTLCPRCGRAVPAPRPAGVRNK